MGRFLRLIFWSAIILSLSGHGYAQVSPEGKLIRFNGIDQYLSIPNHPDFNIAAGESFTLTCRINPDNFNAPYIILSKGNQLIPEARYELSTTTTKTAPNLAFDLLNTDQASLGSRFITTLQPGKWIHFAWVYQASDKSSRIYINGGLAGTVTSSAIGRGTVQNLYDLAIGCGWTDPSNPTRFQFWPGQMDELRIWKRALPAAEVTADQTAPRANASGLLAAYDFENISNNIVPDVSGKGHKGQLYGFGIRVVYATLPVGMGEVNERLTAFRIVSGSSIETVRKITIDLTGTNSISDLSAVKIYYGGTSERLDMKTAILYGSATPTRARFTIPGNQRLAAGENWFWVTADINPGAREGNRVRASVLSYANGEGADMKVPLVQGSRTILLANKLLFCGGDGGSKNWRIPAIVSARDGSLVTATDKRWTSPYDLPKHIDVVIRRSIDKGKTWSPALTIAGEGTETGFGDPALVVNRKTGEIICLFASGNGFFRSTPTFPIRIYQSKSYDNGISWTSPQDITTQIYGAESLNPLTRNWQGAFVSSGTATQLKSGRLMAVMPVRETSSRQISDYILYSDDGGGTWQVSPGRAAKNGNEGKLVGLENGNILMSIRNNGTRMFAISTDQGMTWGESYPQPGISDPSCNGDLIRYTAISEGFIRNRLLHSIPFSSSRSNVSILLSYDEGTTWPVRKTINSGPSAYSSLCILNDGTIGMYYESGEYETYEMYFVRFSLEWLSNGKDIWIDRRTNLINSTSDIAVKLAEMKVYPNPASDFVHVSGELDRGSAVYLYNAQGKLISSARVEDPAGEVEVSLRGLPPGIYFVKHGGSVTTLVVK